MGNYAGNGGYCLPPTSISLRVSPCYLRAAVIILPVRIMCITGRWTGLAATVQVEWT